jgi:electron transfer flavoprotein alpha subunit
MTPDVVVCTWASGRELADAATTEALTLGRRAAAALGGRLRWLVLGDTSTMAPQTAAQFGVGSIDRLQCERLASFRPDLYVEALAQYCAARAARLVLMPQTFDSRVLAPRLAVRTGGGAVMNALDIEVDGADVRVTASAYGGDTRAVYALSGAGTDIIAVMPGAVEPEPVESRDAVDETNVVLDLGAVEERIRVIEPAHTEGPRLEDATVIVAGGRGLGTAANFRLVEELAEAVGGMAAASRPIVDDGWVDPSRQVGLTGKIVRPVLYIAVGVSGASQHMAGCSAAKTIVAINRDADAAIFRHAKYGVVGDCVEFVPELIRALRGG